MFSIFWVTISLSVRGLANWPVVVRRVQQYLDMLRAAGPLEWIFEEMKLIARTKYGAFDDVITNK